MNGVNAMSWSGGFSESHNDVLNKPPSWVSQHNSLTVVPTKSVETAMPHLAGERLLQFYNNTTGTAGYVRPGQLSDREELEEMILRARVGKQEAWARSGYEFDDNGGFLDDMRDYVRSSLTNSSILPYVTVVTDDQGCGFSGEKKLAGYAWIEPATLPNNAHIFRQFVSEYGYLCTNAPIKTTSVCSIGAIVVDEHLRRRGIADLTYLAMLQEMEKRGVEKLTFEIYHLLTTVRRGTNDALENQNERESIEYQDVINQENVPSMKMHEGMGATKIGWVPGPPKLISAADRDELTHFLSRLYIMNVGQAVSILRKKLENLIVT